MTTGMTEVKATSNDAAKMRPMSRADKMARLRAPVLVGVFALVLAACQLQPATDDSGETPADASPDTPTSGDETVEFSLSTWGQADLFEAIADAYEVENPNVSIEIEEVPFDAYYSQIDTRLSGGQAPDIMRIQYQRVGFYAQEEALIDLTPYLDDPSGDEFIPELWTAVTTEGEPRGLPLDTDVGVVYYNVDYFEQAGIEPPQTIDDCWNWDEFLDVSTNLREESDAEFGFAAGWTQGNSFRWLPYHYMTGGQVASDDFTTSLLDSEETQRTIEWTQSWFENGHTPRSASLQSGDEVQNLFATGVIGMMIHGGWMTTFLADNMTDWEWDVTYMPCANEMATVMGGNALAVTRDASNPAVAADFVEFFVNEENQTDYAPGGNFLPVRTALLEEGRLEYPVRPDVRPVLFEQAQTIPDHMAALQVQPWYAQLNEVLAEELDAAYVGGQSAEQTARNLHDELTAILDGQN